MFRDLIDDDDYSPNPETFLAVPYVPTDEKMVNTMLDLAGVGPSDLLYDLGSGDGRIVVAAARDRNARAIGIEADPLRVADAMEYAGLSRVEFQADFIEDDIFTADFHDATVVTMYLLQSVNLELRPRLLSELRPGTRIVSHAFDMGDWPADEVVQVGHTKVFKWVVPAQVAGTWTWQRADGQTWRVELTQSFQMVSGQAWLDDQPAQLTHAALQGDSLSLTLRAPDAAPAEHFTLNFSDGALLSAIPVA